MKKKNLDLSDLIKACGKEFMSLRKVWNEKGDITDWIAESDLGKKPPIVTIGKTPEIAVANLWNQLKRIK